MSSTWLIKNILTADSPSTFADTKKSAANSESNDSAYGSEINGTISLKPQPELNFHVSVRGVAPEDSMIDNSEREVVIGRQTSKPKDSSFDNVGSFNSNLIFRTFGASNRIDKYKSSDDPALIQFVSFCADIKKYRNNLKQEDKSEFDRKNLQWHLYFKLYVILHS
jgi:hypothetical protein